MVYNSRIWEKKITLIPFDYLSECSDNLATSVGVLQKIISCNLLLFIHFICFLFPDKDRCKHCQGRKTVKERKILEVHIVKGMKDGQKITFSGEGDQEPGIEPGDVIIVLDEKNHPVFKRSDIDLYMQLVGVSVMESSQSTSLH